MQQAWHIFKKDIRFLRGEIALVWGLAFLFFWTYEVSDNLGGIGSVLIAAALYLIARVMFAEPIPGSEQFWLTRPYRWGSLLAAKLLFILLCVNLPVLIARTAIVMAEGFPLFPALPGLLWSQGVMFLCVSLPVAALAALTPGLVPFLLSALAAATLWFASDYIDSPQYRNFMTARFLGEVRALEFEWVRSAVLAAAAMIMALTVLYVQYRKRATLLSRGFACSMAVLGIFAYLSVPFAFAWAVQPDTSRAFDRSSVDMVLRPPAESREALPSERYFEIDLGLTLEGLAEGDEARMHALELSVQGAGGKTLDIGPLGEDRGVLGLRILPLELRSKGVRFNAGFLVERSLIVEKDRFVPVTLRGALYFTVFGNPQDEFVLDGNNAVLLRNGLRCGFDEWRGFQSNYYFRCKSGLRWPAQLFYVNRGPLNATVSFSPFPAYLGLSPIDERGRYMRADEPRSQLTVTTKHIIAHVKKDFTMDNVRLETYARNAFSPPDGTPGQ
jgi:hypothetical protein